MLHPHLHTLTTSLTSALTSALACSWQVHAIVRASLGATLARTQHISDLRTLFGKARTGGLAQRTAIEWSTTAGLRSCLRGDNIKEQLLVARLPQNIRVEVLSLMFKELRRAECGLEGSVSLYAMAALATHCWPAVFLAKQVIVNANAVVADVYILQHGSLRLSGGVSCGSTQQVTSTSATDRQSSVKRSSSRLTRTSMMRPDSSRRGTSIRARRTSGP